MEELTPTVITKDKVQQWIERNKDIPYHVLVNGTCRRCGKASWTETGLHWCVVEPPKKHE